MRRIKIVLFVPFGWVGYNKSVSQATFEASANYLVGKGSDKFEMHFDPKAGSAPTNALGNTIGKLITNLLAPKINEK